MVTLWNNKTIYLYINQNGDIKRTEQPFTWYADAWKLPKDERAKLRSKTFDGIAKAMAVQWSSYACR